MEETKKVRKTKGRDSKEYAEWRVKVLTRDSYTCQECGCANRRILHCHHIKNWQHYIFSRFDVKNGITLCALCHAKKHPGLSGLIRGKDRKKKRSLNRKIKLFNRK